MNVFQFDRNNREKGDLQSDEAIINAHLLKYTFLT